MPHKVKRNYSDKPYNRCIACAHRTESRCCGLRTSVMPLADWCEYMRDLKDAAELTNEDIAEQSGVSIATIDSLMSGHRVQDIMRETARLIEAVILGAANRTPCMLNFEEEQKPTSSRAAEANAEIDRLSAENAELRRKVEYLLHENKIKSKVIMHLLDEPEAEQMFDTQTVPYPLYNYTDLAKE